MNLTARATSFAPPRLGRVIAIAILVLALVALTIVAIGSRQHRVPPPFGPARNGEIVSSADGDIFLVDPVMHSSSPLIAGPTFDFGPVSPATGRNSRSFAGGRPTAASPIAG